MGTITIRGLAKSFGAHVALHPLDLDIGERQFVTLLGPSGCGKTTTLRLLAGFMSPDAGTIAVAGRTLSSPSEVVPPERRGMGMVFQNYALWPHMTVFENVAFGLRMQRASSGEIARRVAAALETVGLEDVGARNPAALSGGQQQRVALARSLVTEPAILLLDEPLSNLDAKLRERMRGELRELQTRTGITFVYVTHDQSEAMALSDRIAVMSDGRLQQFGSPSEIYDRPANRFVADFMGAANLLDGSGGPLGIALDAGFTLPLAAPRTGRVTVMLRPEDIEISTDPIDGAPTAEVTECSYLGSVTEYRLTVAGVGLRAQSQRGRIVDRGSMVWLTFSTTRSLVL